MLVIDSILKIDKKNQKASINKLTNYFDKKIND